MIIDVLGMPGIGKSTALKHARERFLTRDIDAAITSAYASAPRAASGLHLVRTANLVHLALHPRLVRAAPGHVRSASGLNDVANLSRRDLTVASLARRNGTTAVDEGAIHKLCGMVSRRNYPPEVVDELTTPDAVILLEADPDVVLARTRARPQREPESKMTDAELLRHFARYTAAVRHVVARVAVPLIAVDAGGPPGTIADLLADEVAGLVREAGRSDP